MEPEPEPEPQVQEITRTPPKKLTKCKTEDEIKKFTGREATEEELLALETGVWPERVPQGDTDDEDEVDIEK